MNLTRSRQSTIAAILIALIFHSALLFYLFYWIENKRAPIIIVSNLSEPELSKIKEKPFTWVQHEKPPLIAPQPERSGKSNSTNTADDEKSVPVMPEPQHAPVSASPTPQQPAPMLTQHDPAAPGPHSAIADQIAQPKQTISTAHLPEPFDPRSRILKPEYLKKPTATKIGTDAQKMSLAQIAQNFSHYAQNENRRTATAISNIKGLPTDEQLAHENYMNKIAHQFIESSKRYREKAPRITGNLSRIIVGISLNRDGTIHDLILIESSGSPALDQFVFFLFRDASSSYPPVPKSFPQDPYTFSILI